METSKGNRIDISEIIDEIYSSEIACRIEWMFDAGYCWTIQNNAYPRLFIDDGIDGSFKIIAETSENTLMRNNPFMEKDWVVREYTRKGGFQQAVIDLSEKICELYPNEKFSVWYIQKYQSGKSKHK